MTIHSTTTVEIRDTKIGERPHVQTTMERWHAAGASGFLLDTYPQVFSTEADAVSVCAFAHGKVVSHAAYREVSLATSAGDAHVYLVGSVATAPEMRERGFASDVLSEIVQRGEAAGVDAVLLWSDKWGFYQRLGFEPAGRQVELVIKPRPGTLAAGIRPAHAGDLLDLLTLHRLKPLRVERSLHDMALQLGVPRMTTMVLERGHRVVAYACFGKGIDFQGWWHELGGSDGDLATLILGTMEVMGIEKSTVLMPPYRPELLRRLGPSLVSSHEGAGALRRALTPIGNADFFVDGLDSI